MVTLDGEPPCASCPLSCGLPALLCLLTLSGVAFADDDANRVGFVDKVENEAMVVSNEATAMALIGTAIHLKDELRTGAGGRLQVTFRDNTVLTLGENASVVVDRYVFDPDEGVGETVLQATKGAFRFASGRIKELREQSDRRVNPGRRYRRARHRVLGRAARQQIWGAVAAGRSECEQSGGQREAYRAGTGDRHPLPARGAGTGAAWAPDKIDRAIATVTMH